MFLGLRTVVYKVNDLNKAKKWYSEVLGTDEQQRAISGQRIAFSG